jgi:hypothetical protein
VVATRNPPATPASFGERRALLEKTPGQPLSATQASTLAQRQPQHGGRSDVRLATGGSAAAARDRTTGIGPAANERSAKGMPGRIEPGATGPAVHGAPLRSSGYAHGGAAQQHDTRTPQMDSDRQHGRGGIDTDKYVRALPSSRSNHAPVDHGGPARSQSSYAEGGHSAHGRSAKSQAGYADSGQPANRVHGSSHGASPSSVDGRATGKSHGKAATSERPQYARTPERFEGPPPEYREHGPAREQGRPDGPRQSERQRPGKEPKGHDKGGPH